MDRFGFVPRLCYDVFMLHHAAASMYHSLGLGNMIRVDSVSWLFTDSAAQAIHTLGDFTTIPAINWEAVADELSMMYGPEILSLLQRSVAPLPFSSLEPLASLEASGIVTSEAAAYLRQGRDAEAFVRSVEDKLADFQIGRSRRE